MSEPGDPPPAPEESAMEHALDEIGKVTAYSSGWGDAARAELASLRARCERMEKERDLFRDILARSFDDLSPSQVAALADRARAALEHVHE